MIFASRRFLALALALVAGPALAQEVPAYVGSAT